LRRAGNPFVDQTWLKWLSRINVAVHSFKGAQPEVGGPPLTAFRQVIHIQEEWVSTLVVSDKNLLSQHPPLTFDCARYPEKAA